MEIRQRPLPYIDGDKWGYIRTDGSILCAAEFDYVGLFSEGYAYIEQESSLSVVDQNLRTLSQIKQAGSYHRFSSQFLVVSSSETDRMFYIDVQGKKAFDSDFDNAFDFSGDRAFAQMGDKWGMLDRAGHWVVEPSFNWAASFEPGSDITSVCPRENGPCHLIDRDGKIVSRRKFDLLRCVAEGLVPFGRRRQDGQMRFGVADESGREVIPPMFTECDGRFHHGLLGVETDEDTWGVIDRTGHWVINPAYTYLGRYRDGLLLAYQGGGRTLDRHLEDGKFGFVDRSGSVKIDFQFDDALPFDGGIARVDWCVDPQNENYDMLMGYVNIEGRIIWRESQRE